ncbi:hypothetical protein ACNIZK_05055 [Citrobacter portucalensis]
MSVKRYDMKEVFKGRMAVVETSAGAFVSHGDYAVLEQKLTDLAVQLANAESKCRALAAENAGLKAAFDKPQAYLSWHAIPPTWEDPLPCGEYLDVHDEAGHKNSDGTDCWPIFAKPEIETPATESFLAEMRAQGVEMAACALDDVNQFNYANMLDDLAQKIRQEAAQ